MDHILLETGEVDNAQEAKVEIEEKQRRDRKLRAAA